MIYNIEIPVQSFTCKLFYACYTKFIAESNNFLQVAIVYLLVYITFFST